MSLKDIRCSIRKTNIILLLILLLNKARIFETIDISYCLVERLDLESIVEEKVIPIKGDYLTVKNLTCALY